MSRAFWGLVALMAAGVTVFMILASIESLSNQNDPQSEADASFLVGCCLSLMFATLSVYSLSVIGKVSKQNKRDQQQTDMLNELRTLRVQQVSNPDQQQIQLASQLWKQGKRISAIEILETMPHNPRAKAILDKIHSSGNT